MGLRSLTALLVWQAAVWAASPQVSVSVIDQGGQPIAEARIQLKRPDGKVSTAGSDQRGRAEFTQLDARRYEILITKDGFEPVKREVDLSLGQSVAIELTLIPALERREKVEVRGIVGPIEQG